MNKEARISNVSVPVTLSLCTVCWIYTYTEKATGSWFIIMQLFFHGFHCLVYCCVIYICCLRQLSNDTHMTVCKDKHIHGKKKKNPPVCFHWFSCMLCFIISHFPLAVVLGIVFNCLETEQTKNLLRYVLGLALGLIIKGDSTWTVWIQLIIKSWGRVTGSSNDSSHLPLIMVEYLVLCAADKSSHFVQVLTD